MSKEHEDVGIITELVISGSTGLSAFSIALVLRTTTFGKHSFNGSYETAVKHSSY